MYSELSIAEKLLFIAQNPKPGGSVMNGLPLIYGWIGAVLIEMADKTILRLDGEYLKTQHQALIEDPLHTEIFKIISKSTKERKTKYWVQIIARKASKLKKGSYKNLQQQMMIRTIPKKFLWIKYEAYELIEKRAYKNEIRNLKEKIMNQNDLSNEDLILLNLIDACSMHSIFEKKRRDQKVIKEKLKALILENPLANSVGQTLKEIQAAIMVSIMASVAVSTTVTSN